MDSVELVRCRGCLADAVRILIDFGPQPPSNRFLREGDVELDRHPLIVAQCRSCGLLQLADPMPVNMVASRFDWLTYNEPEGHLDSLVDDLLMLLRSRDGPQVFGLTYKDDTTLRRLREQGLGSIALDLRKFAPPGTQSTAIERLQAAVTRTNCRSLARRHSHADLLVARHVLEHAHDPRSFLRSAFELVKPGGYLMLEVPDCSKFVAAGDVCFFWEEHVSYFSPSSLSRFIAACGGAIQLTRIYPYPMENSLVVVVRMGPRAGDAAACAEDPHTLAAELEVGRALSTSHPEAVRRYRSALAELHAQGRRIFAFGAGHLAAKFINFNNVAEYLSGVIDDSEYKQGLRMPGSRLEIVGSGILDQGEADLCLLSLSPESEAKVLEAKKAYLESGGEMRSMFSLSPRALLPIHPRFELSGGDR